MRFAPPAVGALILALAPPVAAAATTGDRPGGQRTVSLECTMPDLRALDTQLPVRLTCRVDDGRVVRATLQTSAAKPALPGPWETLDPFSGRRFGGTLNPFPVRRSASELVNPFLPPPPSSIDELVSPF